MTKEIEYLINYLKKSFVLEKNYALLSIGAHNKQQLLELSKKRQKAIIQWEDVCAVFSIEKIHDYYKSLIIDRRHKVIVSEKSSNQLIFELTEKLGLKYEQFATVIGKHHYKIPYVYKHFIILPDSGVTKRKVNWYFLNHLTGYDKERQLDYTTLQFVDTIEIATHINFDFFDKQLQLIYQLYANQLKQLNEWLIDERIESRLLYRQTLQWRSANSANDAPFIVY